MRLGEKHHIIAEIEPVDLDSGEYEYGPMTGMDGKPEKPIMSGRFKIHSMEIHSPESTANAADKKKQQVASPPKGKRAGRY